MSVFGDLRIYFGLRVWLIYGSEIAELRLPLLRR